MDNSYNTQDTHKSKGLLTSVWKWNSSIMRTASHDQKQQQKRQWKKRIRNYVHVATFLYRSTSSPSAVVVKYKYKVSRLVAKCNPNGEGWKLQARLTDWKWVIGYYLSTRVDKTPQFVNHLYTYPLCKKPWKPQLHLALTTIKPHSTPHFFYSHIFTTTSQVV